MVVTVPAILADHATRILVSRGATFGTSSFPKVVFNTQIFPAFCLAKSTTMALKADETGTSMYYVRTVG